MLSLVFPPDQTEYSRAIGDLTILAARSMLGPPTHHDFDASPIAAMSRSVPSRRPWSAMYAPFLPRNPDACARLTCLSPGCRSSSFPCYLYHSDLMAIIDTQSLGLER